MGKMNNPKKQTRLPYNNGNAVESIKDLTRNVVKSTTHDFLGGVAREMFEEFGLAPRRRISGTLAPSEPLDLSKIREEEKTPTKGEQKETFISREKFLSSQKEKGVEQEVQVLLIEIKREIKRFAENTQKLETETAKIIVEEVPPHPGIYHRNFFEWLLNVLRLLREKVEDANLWLMMAKNKKIKKGYWAKWKTHGTSFGLSSERGVATQTG